MKRSDLLNHATLGFVFTTIALVLLHALLA